MIDMRDPRGILTFIVRYLALQLGLLVLLVFSFSSGFVLLTFICLLGLFTFLQVLIAIPRKFLDKAGSWKPVAIAGALLSDVAVLWWLGGIVSGFFVDSNWELVAIWLPFHFLAAFFAWGLREIFHAPDPQRTTTPSTSGSPTAPVETKNLSDSEDTEADIPTTNTEVTEAEASTDTNNQ